MNKDIIIREYEDKDLDAVSNIVVRNMLEVNSKDYGLDVMEEYAKGFSKEELANKFQYRKKIWVAEKDNEVVGSVGLEADWDGTKDTYWVLTLFVKPECHGQKIGTMLMNKLEEYAREIKAKKIIIPASITGNEFYHKLGYKYKNNKKELDEKQHYMMEKDL